MDSKVSNSLTYNGKVNLKLKVGNKIVNIKKKNAAELAMFVNICKYLTGNGAGNSEIPKYLDIKRRLKSDTTGSWESILNRTVSLSAANYTTTETSGIASFTGTVSYKSVNTGDSGIAFPTIYDYRLYLVSGSDAYLHYTDLAHIDIEQSDLSNFTSGTVLIVEWIITISQAD